MACEFWKQEIWTFIGHFMQVVYRFPLWLHHHWHHHWHRSACLQVAKLFYSSAWIHDCMYACTLASCITYCKCSLLHTTQCFIQPSQVPSLPVPSCIMQLLVLEERSLALFTITAQSRRLAIWCVVRQPFQGLFPKDAHAKPVSQLDQHNRTFDENYKELNICSILKSTSSMFASFSSCSCTKCARWTTCYLG